MIEHFSALGYPLQLLIMALAGLVAGSFVNWASYALTSMPRPISPWSSRHPRDADSHWLDRSPVFGWIRMRHRGRAFGYDFWIRPVVVELVCAALWAGLYHWEVGRQGLVFQLVPAFPQPAPLSVVWSQFAAHVVLMTLMLAVTLIDIDDYTIPDELIVPGTCLAMAFAVLLPYSHLPDVPPAFINLQNLQEVNVPIGQRPMQMASPLAFPVSLGGWPSVGSLALGCGCWLGWCFALLPRTWYGRHGWQRAVSLCVASVCRRSGTRLAGVLATVGCAAIVAVWFRGGWRWESLLSSLVGLAVGGGVVWYIRLAGGWTLGREAMGFGDVTLLAMIGAFLGWQAALFTFFVAPFAGAVLGIVKRLTSGDGVIPFGPFLCLGATVVVCFWLPAWDYLKESFFVPWLIPAGLVGCLVIIVPVLLVYRLMRYGGADPAESDL
ncbi:MAG: prepilin peptidase [Planctomycetes bacterium]|nr:prepilin peptidase [Planctomycetota bacterium]